MLNLRHILLFCSKHPTLLCYFTLTGEWIQGLGPGEHLHGDADTGLLLHGLKAEKSGPMQTVVPGLQPQTLKRK